MVEPIGSVVRARILLVGALLLIASSCRGDLGAGCPRGRSLQEGQAPCVVPSNPAAEGGVSGQSDQVRIYGTIGLAAGAVSAAAAVSDRVLRAKDKRKQRTRIGSEWS